MNDGGSARNQSMPNRMGCTIHYAEGVTFHSPGSATPRQRRSATLGTDTRCQRTPKGFHNTT